MSFPPRDYWGNFGPGWVQGQGSTKSVWVVGMSSRVGSGIVLYQVCGVKGSKVLVGGVVLHDLQDWHGEAVGVLFAGIPTYHLPLSRGMSSLTTQPSVLVVEVVNGNVLCSSLPIATQH